MSRRGLPPNDARQERKRTKRAERRKVHEDKYADRVPDPMATKLAELAEHFNGGAERG